MSTLFPRLAIVSVLLGCGQAVRTPQSAAPAPPDDTREWKQITVSGAYGTFDVPVPVLTLSTAEDAEGSIVVDSVALLDLEKRLTARVGRIARAQAAALIDTSASRIIKRNPAPVIKPGLIATIPFDVREVEPTANGATRIVAASALLYDLPGAIRIIALAHGTDGVQFDVALTRARRVYMDLLAADPRLANRAAEVMVRAVPTLPGAPVPDPAVEVYYSQQ